MKGALRAISVVVFFLNYASFSLVSYVHKHDDGRVSFPYFFLYVIPPGNCNES